MKKFLSLKQLMVVKLRKKIYYKSICKKLHMDEILVNIVELVRNWRKIKSSELKNGRNICRG